VPPDSYRDFESFVFNFKILIHKVPIAIGTQSKQQRNTKGKTSQRSLFQQPLTTLNNIKKTIMEIAYINGSFIPKEDIRISPDDRGFIFGDGIYEVMKWYGSFFFDSESHLVRLKRSLREVRITWPQSDSFLKISSELIERNHLESKHALIYAQITRGAAPRNHSFPDPETEPTVYAFAREIKQAGSGLPAGVGVLLSKDIRWSRCDIKSVSLLANILSFQEAHERGMKECIFVRDGVITEGSRSNIFVFADGTLFTHPESGFILSGVSRKNIIRIAKESGIPVREEPFPEKDLSRVQEAFITNTSAEITPVTSFEAKKVGNGMPGPITTEIHKKFQAEILAMKKQIKAI
jgi:D-alanine transaminase